MSYVYTNQTRAMADRAIRELRKVTIILKTLRKEREMK